MNRSKIKKIFAFTFLALFFLSVQNVSAQLDRIEKDRAKGMLKEVVNQIESNYYDPNFRGIDLKAKEKEAIEKINNATSLGQAFGIIAQVLLDFEDSHTFFIPPARAAKIEYGWKMQMIDDKAFVYAVKPKSDAHEKGLKAGDLVLSVNGFRPTRKDLWKMDYYYYSINPQTKMKMLIQSPGNEPREIIIDTKVVQTKRVVDLTDSIDFNSFIRELSEDSESYDHRFVRPGKVVVWKMPTFSFDPNQVANIMNGEIKKADHLILDLRRNGGGYVKTLEELAGFMFDQDVKIADMKTRKESEESVAKSKGNNVFKGRIIVLIDSKSGSASELFARLMQIENRGKVLGDVSAGAVMVSRQNSSSMGVNKLVLYGASVTVGDVIMTDGESLENVGVIPDETILVTGADLANERDPVLARAFEMLGVEMSPEQAGKFFPIFWADGKKGNVTGKTP
jgi:carboxyl-terminal processing protease